jgi:hypothetical protein
MMHSAAEADGVKLSDFEALLDNSTGEREVAFYLKRHPRITYWTFCRASGHTRYVLNEFALGNEFAVDCVIVNSYSGVGGDVCRI